MTDTVFVNLIFDGILFICTKANLLVSICHYLQIIENS